MTSGIGRLGAELTELLPSLDDVAAGVRGGECTAVVGGECFGDGGPDPAGIYLLFGVVVPDPTWT